MEPKSASRNKAIILAHYLPQFHPIPENNDWWGNGFTEWTNVKKAKPLFRGHKQPVIPGELGYYDLRNTETRERQAELARSHGITGFAYWHYWFGNGRRLLQKPFDEVLECGRPDFPFCLAWANESWTGTWHGLKDKILVEQQYPGEKDYINHFNHVLKAFRDDRYIKIENKPLFIVYLPHLMPDALAFTRLWNKLAKQNGFDGMYFIGIHYAGWDHEKDGFDLKSVHPLPQYVSMFEQDRSRKWKRRIFNRLTGKLKYTYHFHDLIKSYDLSWLDQKDCMPSLLANWDNTPRTSQRGWVVQGSTPELFGQHCKQILEYVVNQQNNPHNIIFIKSWNEWAEGNYLEPDNRWGNGFLNAILESLRELNIETTLLIENDESVGK
nr:glycoside hydrolase family 99-like domain-containing protein [Bacteroidota bacterium]